jgi:Uncharacterized conserved protein (DUF2278)
LADANNVLRYDETVESMSCRRQGAEWNAVEQENKDMTLKYGYVKCKIVTEPELRSSRHKQEVQYHLHATLRVAAADGGGKDWDTAVNVGTNDADDLLKYKLVFDYHNPIRDTLSAAAGGFHDLTGARALPALDFLRADVLADTGDWRKSDVMDGSEFPEPVASLKRLFHQALVKKADVYIFGRTYTTGGPGIHDVHMNQGSRDPFLNDGKDDHNDHNDVWQDGAVLVDLGESQWAGYFTAFTQQLVPTDGLGNPGNNSHPIQDADPGRLIGK